MRRRLFSLALAMVLGATACSDQQSTNDKIRKQAADATAQIKKGAQVAANDIKAESKQIGGQAKAAAQGVREGWNRDKDGTLRLNLNSASVSQLAALGISDRGARAVVRNRPYHSTSDLVSKKVLSQAEFDRIQDRVTAGPQS
jgi:DNA uptake protein ComE-like DNA-binding protein